MKCLVDFLHMNQLSPLSTLCNESEGTKSKSKSKTNVNVPVFQKSVEIKMLYKKRKPCVPENGIAVTRDVDVIVMFWLDRLGEAETEQRVSKSNNKYSEGTA